MQFYNEPKAGHSLASVVNAQNSMKIHGFENLCHELPDLARYMHDKRYRATVFSYLL
jgi:hypothetical protein